MINEINDWVTGHEETIKSSYHYLHTNAEVSWKEIETKKFLCLKLERLGIPYETFNNHNNHCRRDIRLQQFSEQFWK